MLFKNLYLQEKEKYVFLLKGGSKIKEYRKKIRELFNIIKDNGIMFETNKEGLYKEYNEMKNILDVYYFELFYEKLYKFINEKLKEDCPGKNCFWKKGYFEEFCSDCLSERYRCTNICQGKQCPNRISEADYECESCLSDPCWFICTTPGCNDVGYKISNRYGLLCFKCYNS